MGLETGQRYTTREAISLIYEWLNRARPLLPDGPDRVVRHPEWTGRLLAELGNPDAAAFNVAVTGSKGKGSNAILLAAILQCLGLRVGLFTSPHLIDFMERIRLGGQVMPEAVFVHWMTQVYDEARRLPVPPSQYIGPVGLLACVAALWFADEQTDVNVFELGRGALHDDVNQVRHEGALLTPVFLEHARELGPTLPDVAREKAGVLRTETRWLVSHPQSETVQAVLNRCGPPGTDTQLLGCDFSARVDSRPGGDETRVWVRFAAGDETCIRLPGVPDFLARNAAVAAAAARQVAKERWGHEALLPDEIDLRRVRLPGRMEVIARRPLVLVDGTVHRETALHVGAWAASATRRGSARRFGAVLAIPVDKDGMGVLGALQEHVQWVVWTGASNPHLRFDDRFCRAALALGMRSEWVPDVAQALDAAWARVDPADGLLLLGTQSFVADVMQHFAIDTRTIWRLGE
ncbi:hypothetical protein [Alicyclobacillus shizuokensis]|uniref:hypothetical protein n=1 Tax=Alicyclobacillus shizuokensis TaxID=392014 RepID=UPI0008375C29|nr:hypothetical protein [Alicyclobacillus shizuokensis]